MKMRAALVVALVAFLIVSVDGVKQRNPSATSATSTRPRAKKASRSATPSPTASAEAPHDSGSSSSSESKTSAFGCDFDASTVQAIQDLFTGKRNWDSTIELHCLGEKATGWVESVGLEEAATVTGGAVGAVSGGAAGMVIGEALGGLFGDDWKETGATWGAAVGGIFGGLAGAVTGNVVAKVFSSEEFVGNKSKGQALDECRALLGVTSASSVAEIRKAYKAAALNAHPDKGGTQEQIVRVNFCKEALLAVAPKSAAGGDDARGKSGSKHDAFD